MPAALRWLSYGCLTATALTLVLLLLGPQEGLETLAGGLLAVFVLVLHVPAGLVFLILGFQAPNRGIGFWLMAVYFLFMCGLGSYQYIVINDIDDAAKDLIEAKVDNDSFQLRELGLALYQDAVLEVPANTDALNQWRGLALTAREVNRRDEKRMPALWYAAGLGDVEMIERLLGRGAKTDDPALYPTTPLVQAVRHNQVAAAKLLLDGDADPDQGLHAQLPALSLAAKNQNLAMAALLIAHQADVSLGSPTAFTIAVRNGSVDIVALLLDEGAQPEIRSSNRFPLEIALQNDDLAMLELLIARTPGFQAISDRRDPMLFQALNGCDLKAFKRYLDLGASADVTNRKNQPILTYLIQLNFTGCQDLVRFVEALLSAGVTAQSQDLLLALQRGQPDVARALHGQGVATEGELNKRNFLMLAASAGAADLVNAALDQGFDVNVWSDGMNRSSALHEASRSGQTAIVQLLLKRGARLPDESINLRNLFRFAAPHPTVLERLLMQYRTTEKDQKERSQAIARSVIASKNERAIALLDQFGLAP